MKECRPFPKRFLRVFDESVIIDDESESPASSPLPPTRSLFPGDTQTVDLNRMYQPPEEAGAGQLLPVELLQDAVLRFIFPEECIGGRPPLSSFPSAKEVEEKGEFLCRLQHPQLTPHLTVLWDRVVSRRGDKLGIIERTRLLLRYIWLCLKEGAAAENRLSLECGSCNYYSDDATTEIEWAQAQPLTPLSSSKKRRACSLLFELVEICWLVGSKLNLFQVDWAAEFSLGRTKEMLPQTSHKSEVSASDNGTRGAEGAVRQNCVAIPMMLNVGGTNNGEGAVAVTFRKQLLRTVMCLIEFGSVREATVALLGVVQNRESSLEAKLLALPILGRVLRNIPSNRASHLINVNSTIHSVFIKTGVIPQLADQSLRQLREVGEGKGEEKEETEGADLVDAYPPFYLRWLLGFSLNLCRYFDELGKAAMVSQPDDFHRVGPSCCASLLAKVLMVIGTTFTTQYIWKNDKRLSSVKLQWSPFFNPAAKDSHGGEFHLEKWIAVSRPAAFKALACLLQRYIQIQGASLFDEFETVNLATPLDDGQGDLELTPCSSAFIGWLEMLHGRQLRDHFDDPHVVQFLPLVISPSRYMFTYLSCCYVLLRCSQLLCRASDQSPGVSLLCPDAPSSVTFHLRRDRLGAAGLDCFLWSNAFWLDAVGNEMFEDFHVSPLKPPHVISAVLYSLSHLLSEPPVELRLGVVGAISRWIARYPLPLRLCLLLCVPGLCVNLDAPPVRESPGPHPSSQGLERQRGTSRGPTVPLIESFDGASVPEPLLVAVCSLFKNEVLAGLSSSTNAANVRKIVEAVIKMSKAVTSSNARLLEKVDSLCSILNIVKACGIILKTRSRNESSREAIGSDRYEPYNDELSSECAESYLRMGQALAPVFTRLSDHIHIEFKLSNQSLAGLGLVADALSEARAALTA